VVLLSPLSASCIEGCGRPGGEADGEDRAGEEKIANAQGTIGRFHVGEVVEEPALMIWAVTASLGPNSFHTRNG
jgi:hypothetical protein